jgi:2-polyprenyl-6-methoxyphenol hydroxylase-like FAD-dependent oxidoreductase
MEQDEKGVTVWLSNPDNSWEEVRYKYVVGCDGAHGIVRKAAGQTFDGGTYPQDLILADVHLKWDQVCTSYLQIHVGVETSVSREIFLRLLLFSPENKQC